MRRNWDLGEDERAHLEPFETRLNRRQRGVAFNLALLSPITANSGFSGYEGGLLSRRETAVDAGKARIFGRNVIKSIIQYATVNKANAATLCLCDNMYSAASFGLSLLSRRSGEILE